MSHYSGKGRPKKPSTLCGRLLRTAIISRNLAYLILMLCVGVPRIAMSQTPSALQEWQYSSGITLQKLYEPDLPKWRVVLGAGAEVQPLYDGARPYRTRAGPVINILYRDVAFASVGEGLGVNFVNGANYRGELRLATTSAVAFRMI